MQMIFRDVSPILDSIQL